MVIKNDNDEETTHDLIIKKKMNNPHKNHRERKINTFLEQEIDSFPEHEILEVLLFYIIPQKDTNEMAHELINHFNNSLYNVLNADWEDLEKAGIKGLKEASAKKIELFRKLSRLFLKLERQNITVNVLDNNDSLNEYCKVLFINSHNEELRIIFLDDDFNLLYEKLIGSGTPGRIDVSLRTIIEMVLEASCTNVVLTHNHPVGTCMPSNTDVNFTRNIWQTLKPMDIKLVDHVIVGSDGVWSMRAKSTMPEIWNF